MLSHIKCCLCHSLISISGCCLCQFMLFSDSFAILPVFSFFFCDFTQPHFISFLLQFYLKSFLIILIGCVLSRSSLTFAGTPKLRDDGGNATLIFFCCVGVI